MSAIATSPVALTLPTHLDLPDTDGKPVDNTYQPTQWTILSESLQPHMKRLHPDGQYLVAVDHGIYYHNTQPPLEGCRVPDLMVVEGVPPILPDFPYRRSYVLWQELVSPTLLMELISGDGKEEHDRTPRVGKFWIYERVINAAFYAIYDPLTEELEVFELSGGRFRSVVANERGHYPIAPLEIEIGLERATIDGLTFAWVRFYDNQGRLLPTSREMAEQEAKRAEQETKRAEKLEQDNERLRKRLRELGVEPNGS